MNILAMGITPWGDRDHLALYNSRCGHEVRLLGIEADADYHFAAAETAAEAIERVARDWPPDVLFCGCPELYPPPRQLEACPILTVAMVSDWNLYQPQLEHNLARFDLVLTDRLGTERLQLEGAEPQYAGPLYSHRSLVHRNRLGKRDIDVLFLGNLNHAIHRERGKVLEQAAALSDEYTVLIDGGYEPETYTALMNRARIVLNYSVRREMNLRTFETLACGALLFTEDSNLEVGDWLSHGIEMVRYNAANLESQLRHYLEHERERQRIARAGAERARELAAEQRMDPLFNTLAKASRGPRPFPSFPEETRELADVLLYASSREPAQRALSHALVDAWCEKNPGLLSARLAAGCACIERCGRMEGAPRRAMLQAGLAHFGRATELAPGEVVPWLNLAIVARQAQAVPLERTCLEHALEAPSATYGGLLLGHVHDPYYAGWRRALAEGRAEPAMLHAAAATRLAEAALHAGEPDAGLRTARTAIRLKPDVAAPYRLAAIAESHAGNIEEAARLLEQGLPYNAFDAAYRMDLATALDGAGRTGEARQLAEISARIFQACPKMEEDAQRFRDWFERKKAER